MQKQIISGIILSFVTIAPTWAQQQQWSGSSTPSGDIFRDGNVDIGTGTLTSAKLQFPSAVGNKIALYDNDIDVGYGFGINGGNLNAYIPAGAPHKFSIRTNAFDGAEKFIVHHTGDVEARGNFRVDSGNGMEFGDQSATVSPAHSKIWENSSTGNLIIRPGGTVDFEGPFIRKLELQGFVYVNPSPYLNPSLKFGDLTSGEGIGSERFAPSNRFGLDFYTSSQNRVSITSSGNVGIGTINPATNLHVVGSLRVNNVIYNSDQRFKTDIQPISNALGKIMALHGTTYAFRKEAFQEQNFSEGIQLGFIAQEVQEVFPNLVSADLQGYLGVRYEGIIPVLVEAMKEQQRQIEEKKAAIHHLEAKVDQLANRLAQIEQLLAEAARR